MKQIVIPKRLKRQSPEPSGLGSFHERLRSTTERALESPKFLGAITAIIIINAIALGLETWPAAAREVGLWLLVVDQVALGLFTLEMCAKLWVYRGRFFKEGWNVFDLTVIALSWVPAAGPLSVLRALRILRLFRTVWAVPQMRAILGALVAAVPGMGAITAVLSLVFYTSAVMTTQLFGAQFPELFGSIGASLFSLFQIMTLEGWSVSIVRPVMEVHPYAWLFFVPFVVITGFAVLSLFIALIVHSLQALHTEDRYRAEVTAALAQDDRNALHIEIAGLRAEMRRIADRLADREGNYPRNEQPDGQQQRPQYRD